VNDIAMIRYVVFSILLGLVVLGMHLAVNC